LGQVLSAIGKVEKYTVDTKASSRRTSMSMSHRDFLQLHIMGIVSHLNSELQDAHGKRSVEAKCKVLRGIKEVLSIIGEASAVVSPQASSNSNIPPIL
jgi:serine/threonine-protein kinase ATR